MSVFFSNIDVPTRVMGKRKVSQWLKSVIESENRALGEIVICLCTDDYIVKMNNQYLQHNYPTDIITFDYSTSDLTSGDLLISVDTVKINSKEYRVTFQEELRRVMVHGVLHLCGYKDKTKKDHELMRAKEDFYLNYEI